MTRLLVNVVAFVMLSIAISSITQMSITAKGFTYNRDHSAR